MAQFFNLVVRLFHGQPEGILEIITPFQDNGFVEVLFVLEELVKGADGKLGLFGDLGHGDIVVALLREEIERGRQHLLALP